MGPERHVDVSIRPTTGALILISLLCTLVLPLVRLYTEVVTTSLGENVSSAVIIFGLIWLLAALVRWRAGRADSFITMTIKTAVATAILMGAAIPIAWVVRDIYSGPEYDTLSEPHLVLFGAWGVVTFVVVAILLSSVRASAHRVQAR